MAAVLMCLPAFASSDKRPNVLFIGVDDLRVELGCYGDTIVKSPNIDALAKRGMRFDRAYCQQALCNPSRASLMTGIRLRTMNIWDLHTHFRQRIPDVVTLPQHFKQNGYFTQNIGKIFHNWRQDDYKGDAISWSVPAVMHYNSHYNDKPQVEGQLPPDLINTPKCEMRDVPDEAYFDGRIANLAVEALGKLKAKGQPWFLAVGFWKPHTPFNAPKKYWDMYDRSQITPPTHPEPPVNVPAIAMHDSKEILGPFPKHQVTPEQVLTLRHGYYAAISYLDAQIGKVIDELDRLGLSDNTVIVFWSDHGYHLGEQALWAKTSNFELDARVPLIIAAPGHPGGRHSDSIVELLDMYPTLVDLCGLPAVKATEGVSLRKVLDDPVATVKPAAYTWHCRPAYPSDKNPIQAMGYSIRTQRYRYTEWYDVHNQRLIARELYDHKSDPHETVNIAGQPDSLGVMNTFVRRMAKIVKPLDATSATHP
ncbi:sulfatase [Planctomycetales bacterium ZRK34]|nr:sulfatase [Planctomycetales bacterium ZRK34]